MIVTRGLGRSSNAPGIVVWGLGRAFSAPAVRKVRNVFVTSKEFLDYLGRGSTRVEIRLSPRTVYAQSDERVEQPITFNDTDLHIVSSPAPRVLTYQDSLIYLVSPRSYVFVTSRGVKV